MNWKKLFELHILERGYNYYCENAVENLDISADIIREWKIKYKNRLILLDELRKVERKL